MCNKLAAVAAREEEEVTAVEGEVMAVVAVAVGAGCAEGACATWSFGARRTAGLNCLLFKAVSIACATHLLDPGYQV